ncbi:MAG: DUF2339 domain-containing protein, partial [Flavobacteriales bacterium]
RLKEDPVQIPFPGSFLFGTAFFLIFYSMSLAYKVRKALSFHSGDISILLSCNALYFALGLSILHFSFEGNFQGLFTVGMAAFNFLFVFRYYRWKSVDRNLFYTLVGLVLTFITLAAPIRLEGDHITLFWSAEAVLLLWLAQKSGISLLKLGSVTVTGLMLISLLMDQVDIYRPVLEQKEATLYPILNPGAITGSVSIASLLGTLRLLRSEQGPFFFQAFPLSPYRHTITGLSILMAYLVPMLELYAQTELRMDHESLRTVIMGTYHFTASLILLHAARLKAPYSLRVAAFFGAILLLLSYLFHYQSAISQLQLAYLEKLQVPLIAYLMHFLLVGGVLLFLRKTWHLLKCIEEQKGEFRPIFRWFATFMLVFLASSELDQLVLWIGAGSSMSPEALREQNAMIGYPILWGLSSFLLMWQGLKAKLRNLRVISLSLFGLTLLKLFIIDIQEIPEVGRVIAFVSLGVLLLVVSFMYQKLKGIVLDEDDE